MKPATWWTRLTEHVDEKRVTWVCGVQGRVLASGEATDTRSGREALRAVVECLLRPDPS